MKRKPISEREERSEEVLCRASKELLYEIQIFSFVADLLLHRYFVQGRKRHWMENPLIEAFLVHTRNLLDFLFPGDTPDEDDIIAHDFFDDWEEWEPGVSALGTYLKSETKEEMSGRWRINKQLSHLTYSRLGITDDQKIWRIRCIAVEILRVLEIFAREVPDGRLYPRFSEELEGYKQIVGGSKNPPGPL